MPVQAEVALHRLPLLVGERSDAIVLRRAVSGPRKVHGGGGDDVHVALARNLELVRLPHRHRGLVVPRDVDVRKSHGARGGILIAVVGLMLNHEVRIRVHLARLHRNVHAHT